MSDDTRATSEHLTPGPYYEDDLVTIYHGDWRDLIDGLSFDQIVTDAPYGVGLDYDVHDDSLESLDQLIDALEPHLESGGPHLVFSGVGNLHRWPQPTWTLCWVEMAGARTGKWGFSTWQPILAYGKDPKLATGKGRHPDSIRFSTGGAETAQSKVFGSHPCPKPLQVMSWLLERATTPDSVILDPFMGSGTTLRAAKDRGMRAIGIDISESYCEIAARRMSQGVLFAEASATCTEVQS